MLLLHGQFQIIRSLSQLSSPSFRAARVYQLRSIRDKHKVRKSHPMPQFLLRPTIEWHFTEDVLLSKHRGLHHNEPTFVIGLSGYFYLRTICLPAVDTTLLLRREVLRVIMKDLKWYRIRGWWSKGRDARAAESNRVKCVVSLISQDVCHLILRDHTLFLWRTTQGSAAIILIKDEKH